MKRKLGTTAAMLLAPCLAMASSHQDAPLISLDYSANTTDVYAFVGLENGTKVLNVGLSVFPFEENATGPDIFRFDDNVRYVIHLSIGKDLAAGRATISYELAFTTTFPKQNTILTFLGPVMNILDQNQNMVQRYTLTRIDHHQKGTRTELGKGKVPPNNLGNVTALYNQNNNGEQPAKEGVSSEDALDTYTREAIQALRAGFRVFAGQRDDEFYGDIQAIFDLLKIRPKGLAQDTQGGFNVHHIVLQIPVQEIGGDQQIIGVYATTLRRSVTIAGTNPPRSQGKFVQVARQGNPLFNEVLVAFADKDHYNQSSPSEDPELFRNYALNPEPARLLNLLVLKPPIPSIETNRTDIAGIYIPDLIKVDLSTDPARLAGNGPGAGSNPDDAGFSRLSVFGGDVLLSKIQTGLDGKGHIPGGWPNGRRYGDDVIDIALTALASDLRTSPPTVRGPFGDNVDHNDIGYNKVFPFAATPHNGRLHPHHDFPIRRETLSEQPR